LMRRKQMHPRKKRRSSEGSGSASDMDPLSDTEDTSALPRKAAAKGDKGIGDKGKGGKGGKGKGRQQQAEVSKEPTAGGVCACVWLWALEVDVSSARVLGCVALCNLFAFSCGRPFAAAAQNRGRHEAASKARLKRSH